MWAHLSAPAGGSEKEKEKGGDNCGCQGSQNCPEVGGIIHKKLKWRSGLDYWLTILMQQWGEIFWYRIIISHFQANFLDMIDNKHYNWASKKGCFTWYRQVQTIANFSVNTQWPPSELFEMRIRKCKNMTNMNTPSKSILTHCYWNKCWAKRITRLLVCSMSFGLSHVLQV